MIEGTAVEDCEEVLNGMLVQHLRLLRGRLSRLGIVPLEHPHCVSGSESVTKIIPNASSMRVRHLRTNVSDLFPGVQTLAQRFARATAYF